MKITKRRLKRLVMEAMNEPSAELTDPNISEEQISASWPEYVTHNGKNVFQTFYSDGAMKAQWAFVNREGYDDGQEAYLGYDPTNDVFVMGFDVWPDDGDMEGLAIELRSDGTPMDVIGSFPGGMYPSGLSGIKRAFPGIIDVRLD